ncbi:MAG: YggS family pyridoxal phosphate-dependent enzyme [Candidatus Anstonellaceae archaeon]
MAETDIGRRLEYIKSRLHEAEIRGGRQPGYTKILYATKYASAQQIALLCKLEQPPLAIGENRVQEAKAKFAQLLSIIGQERYATIEKHMIGNLQSNKIADAVSIFSCIQSISSLESAEKVSKRAEMQGKEIQVYVEVNNGEKSKQGVDFTQVEELAGKIAKLPGLKLAGLMGMGVHGDAHATRVFFRQLRKKADELGLKASMGMSDDFEIAAEEGADMVRIGRAVFASPS